MINVSGHRLSTAEIESALILHPGVAETAGEHRFLVAMLPKVPSMLLIAFSSLATVIGTADELTGQAVHAFVTLKPYVTPSRASESD